MHESEQLRMIVEKTVAVLASLESQVRQELDQATNETERSIVLSAWLSATMNAAAYLAYEWESPGEFPPSQLMQASLMEMDEALRKHFPQLPGTLSYRPLPSQN